MNINRRRELKNLKVRLEIVKREITNISNGLSNVLANEENAFDNMPESLQSSIRGEISEEAIDIMYEIQDYLTDSIKEIEHIINL